jgi:hypothetical protein
MLVEYLSYSFVLRRVSQSTAQLIAAPPRMDDLPPVVHMHLYRPSDPDPDDASATVGASPDKDRVCQSTTTTRTERLLHRGKMDQHPSAQSAYGVHSAQG